MNEIKRLRQLAGLREDIDFLGPDDAEDLDDGAREQQYARERKVEGLIRMAFRRIGLAISDDRFAVNYDEESDREARVRLDDFEADLGMLARLMQSGLSSSFRIVASNSDGLLGLDIVFTVAPELDQVV